MRIERKQAASLPATGADVLARDGRRGRAPLRRDVSPEEERHVAA